MKKDSACLVDGINKKKKRVWQVFHMFNPCSCSWHKIIFYFSVAFLGWVYMKYDCKSQRGKALKVPRPNWTLFAKPCWSDTAAGLHWKEKIWQSWIKISTLRFIFPSFSICFQRSQWVPIRFPICSLRSQYRLRNIGALQPTTCHLNETS